MWFSEIRDLRIVKILLGMLPFVGLAVTIAGVWQKGREPFDIITRGALIWGTFLAVATYLLSLFSLLSFGCVLFIWLAYSICFGYQCFHRDWPALAFPRVSWYHYVVATILALTLLTALLYPPNTWDSMTYHMPRVLHWWQNHGILPYFTNNSRQIEMPPFAEMVILHSYALAESDCFANLPQWLSFAGVICLASAVAMQLGGKTASRIAAAVFMATLPMGILQATSTQNDLMVAFWILCVACRYYAWRDNPIWTNASLFGLAVGLAIATKGTAFIICFPFVAIFAMQSCIRPRMLFPKAVVAGTLAFAVFAPNFLFLHHSTGKLSGEASAATMVHEPTVARFMTIATANLLSHNIVKTKAVSALHRRVASALGIPERDPGTYFNAIQPGFSGLNAHEDNAQNLFHLPAALIAAAWVALHGGHAARRHCLIWAAAAILFCTFVKWQPWITRLQLPLFALAAPMFGLLVDKIRGKVTPFLLFAALMAFYSVRPLVNNPSRPLVPQIRMRQWRLQVGGIDWLDNREKLYFMNRRDLYEAYAKQVDALAAVKPGTVGLVMGGDSWEYPLWPMLRDRLGHSPKMRYIPMPPQIPTVRAFDNPPWEGGEWPESLFVLDMAMPWEDDAARAVNPRAYVLRDGKYTMLDVP